MSRLKSRILSVAFPTLSMDRWNRLQAPPDDPPDTPLALVLEAAHGPVIHAVNEAAMAHGARRGMRLTDARALNPGLQIAPADPDGEATQLADMARWTGRWSPLVEVDGIDGLRLDVSGVAHLFGGECGLIADVRACFWRAGFSTRCAIAPTPAAAWALARFGGDGAICGPDLAAALAPLPIAALRLSPLATRTLERLGLKTIKTLAGIERRSLARRFREADNPLDALDRALGRKGEPLTATDCPTPPRATLRLAEPVVHPEAGPQALDLLVPRLIAELEARKLGARQLSLTGYRVDGGVETASVATSIPTREPGHLKRLLGDKSATLDPGFGFDAFALTADWVEPLGAAQDSLVEEPSGDHEIARLVDRLSVKLGASRVRRPRARESHLPERANGWRVAVLPHPSIPSPQGEGKQRPQRLLDRPEAIAVIYATPEGLPRRFVWRRAVHDIAKVQGPERIAPEWWRQPSGARLRDYYQVEDANGRRYWIYREGVIGDGRGGPPAWFIHGLFG
ncbi:MAG: DNA polymerase Y family protein [Sphingomicrobium sp.]